MGKSKDLIKRVRRTQTQIKDDDAEAALALKKNTRPIAMLLQKKQKQQPKQQRRGHCQGLRRPSLGRHLGLVAVAPDATGVVLLLALVSSLDNLFVGMALPVGERC